MTSETAGYVELQKLYKAKATADVAAVTQHVHSHLTQLKRPLTSIAQDEIALFCKNAQCLARITTR